MEAGIDELIRNEAAKYLEALGEVVGIEEGR